jgi:formiminoglutamate deiminase
VEAITAQAYVEMLEGGFTRVGEFHYLHHDPSGRPYANVSELAGRVAAAAHATGIGLTLLPVFYAHGNFGGAAPTHGQRRFLNGVDGFARLFEASARAIANLDDANLGVAPHSLRAVTPDELSHVVALAPGKPIHIHAAEQTKEVDDCVAWSGMRPVEWLLEKARVDAHWCLVHATHMTRSETKRLAASGVVAGLCPITEANLGDGIFPSTDYLVESGTFGLGTDSNVQIGAADELRGLEYAQRLSVRARNVLSREPGQSTGRTMFDGALEGGARALGVPVWGLREGASADLISFDLTTARLAGRRENSVLDSWIFAGGGIDCVWRRGHKVVAGGRHHNREVVRERYSRVIERLLA